MKEQVIELAEQAGFHFWDAGFADKGILHTTGDKFSQKCFERFYSLARNAALEQAAQKAFSWNTAMTDTLAKEIRELKELTP